MQTLDLDELPASVAQLKDWIGRGESVDLRRDGQEFAHIVPAVPPAPNGTAHPAPKVDWAAQAKEIWGDRVFSAEEVRRMREDELEGEEG